MVRRDEKKGIVVLTREKMIFRHLPCEEMQFLRVASGEIW